MENLVKKCLLGVLAVLSGLGLSAQETSYSLPLTSVGVKVEVRLEQFHAGPYAAYASKLLNLTVREQDAVSAEVVRVELLPRVEADVNAVYTCDAESATLLSLSAQGLVSLGRKTLPEGLSWRFPAGLQEDFSTAGITGADKEVTRIVYERVQTDTADVRIPVEHRVTVAKTLEDKAAEAAEMVLSIRQERLNIAMGNTDASFSGSALSAALQELERLEKEYLTLFQGYTQVQTCQAVYEVIPEAGSWRYPVFRLTNQGPVEEGVKGIPYYLELTPEGPDVDDSAEKKKGKGMLVHYRIPRVCKVQFTKDGKPLLQTRIPIYQLGREAVLNSTK